MSDVASMKLKSPDATLCKIEDAKLDVPKIHSKAHEKRINGLKHVQRSLLEVEAKFFEEMHELECRYAKLYEPFYEKRRQIVTGEYEPNEEESVWPLDELNGESDTHANDTNVTDNGKDQNLLTDSGKQLLKDLKAQFNNSQGENTKGVANFWLETLQAFRVTSEIIQEHDEDVLTYLRDIRVRLLDKKPYGYTLEFLFDENPYFTNRILSKTYELKTEIDLNDPFSYEGPDLSKTIGCKIDWKQGKNLTVKTVTKKLKSKNKKQPPKIIHKEEKQESFFNFFETPKTPVTKTPKSPISSGTEDGALTVAKREKKLSTKSKSDDDDNDEEEDQDELYRIADFEIGQYLREKIIPKAILYYTGEYDDMEEDYEDYEDEDDEGDEEDEDDEDEDEDEDDEDEDELHHSGKKGKNGKKAPNKAIKAPGNSNKALPANTKPGEPTPSECKQN